MSSKKKKASFNDTIDPKPKKKLQKAAALGKESSPRLSRTHATKTLDQPGYGEH